MHIRNLNHGAGAQWPRKPNRLLPQAALIKHAATAFRRNPGPGSPDIRRR